MSRLVQSTREDDCLGPQLTAVNVTLAIIDGLIAAVAYFQLLMLYLRNRHGSCTRQKVFHCLIGASNLGYLMYFVLSPIAKCAQWPCWSHACGFIVMAFPQIVFLATFLLLLSFWVDLCHQATDREEEEDDDEHGYVALGQANENHVVIHSERRHRCFPSWRYPRIRSRQKFVIMVVMLMFVFTAMFALLIWIGMGKNSLNSVTLAQIYSDIFAVVILISGGGLAGYGLLLYHKMSRVQSGRPSRDIRKVVGLAVVSVVCFSVRAFLVLFTDIPVLGIWHSRTTYSSQTPELIFLYYFIGESIPSLVVLWILREIPSRSSEGSSCQRLTIPDSGLLPDNTLINQWVIEEAALCSQASTGVVESKRLSPASRNGSE